MASQWLSGNWIASRMHTYIVHRVEEKKQIATKDQSKCGDKTERTWDENLERAEHLPLTMGCKHTRTQNRLRHRETEKTSRKKQAEEERERRREERKKRE